MEKASGNVALKVHLEELHHIRRIVVDLNRNIRALSRTDEYRENVRLLKIAPGISTLTAMTFLTELYHISRFRSLDNLASYVGLIPDTDSSGEKDTTTGITERRNPVLRGILIESAWIAVRKDPALMMAFEKLCTRMTKTQRHRSYCQKTVKPYQVYLEKPDGVRSCCCAIKTGSLCGGQSYNLLLSWVTLSLYLQPSSEIVSALFQTANPHL